LGAAFTLNGYNAVLGTGSGLAGRAAFSGNSGGFINSVISLRSYDNLPVRIRFRMASDASVAVTGWYVDNIILSTGCGEYNKAAVRNASDAFVDSSRNNLFVFSMPVVVLPLQLVSFTAQKQQKEVLLAWTTSNEVNTSRFEVEKSYNQQNWSSIGTVNSFNNSAADNHYNLTDQHPAEGMNYYRLKMIDRDGKFVYSDIRAVRFSANSGFSIKPNPVDDRLTVQFSGSNNAGYLSVKDLLGRNITTVQTSSAASIVNINTSQLADGVYLVNFTGTAVNYTERVVVKH
jgi:hypothetical protein